MPKASKKQNEEDVQIVLDKILRNPNIKVGDLSSMCGLSTQQVYRILRKLEDDGILFGNPMMIDLGKIGKKRFIIFAKRSGSPPDESTMNGALYSEEFLNSMVSEKLDIIPEDDYTCTGAFDMVTVFIARSSLEAIKYMEFLRNASRGYFSSFSMSEVMFTTRKCMIRTPEVDSFIDYTSDVALYSILPKHDERHQRQE